MSRAATNKVMFGQYLPDLPPTDNTGLTEALNVVPIDGAYGPYNPITATSDALSARARGGLAVRDSTGNAYLYVGTAAALQVLAGTAWTDKTTTPYTTANAGYWRFAQFEELVIATNYEEVPQAITVGAGTDFIALALVGTAPNARQVGIVGRHVVLGDTEDGTNGIVPYRIQWSRIDVATEWPVPNSADALSKQAGEQFLNSEFGAVTGIVGNDQFGIVFQYAGITRMTYIGGDLVYQFDVIDSTRGAAYPNATVKVGDKVYFISTDGFMVTDGVSVSHIGSSRFDRLFIDDVDTAYKDRVYGALSSSHDIIYWIYPGAGSAGGAPNKVLIYNTREDRITRASDNIECLVHGLTIATSLDDLDALFGSIDDVVPPLDDPYWQGGNDVLNAFTHSHELATFAGTPGTATIDSQESELFPGLYTHISGVRPIVQGQDSVTVALGTRDDYFDPVTFGTETALYSRTGTADFRAESRLVRCRVKIVGDFDSAQGIMYQAQPSGAV